MIEHPKMVPLVLTHCHFGTHSKKTRMLRGFVLPGRRKLLRRPASQPPVAEKSHGNAVIIYEWPWEGILRLCSPNAQSVKQGRICFNDEQLMQASVHTKHASLRSTCTCPVMTECKFTAFKLAFHLCIQVGMDCPNTLD